MKKIIISLFGILFAVLLSVAIFPCEKNFEQTASAAISQERLPLLSQKSWFSISQQGKIYDENSDFSKTIYKKDGKEYPTIITNKSITISILYDFDTHMFDSYYIHLGHETEVNTLSLGNNATDLSNTETKVETFAGRDIVYKDYYKPYEKESKTIQAYFFNVYSENFLNDQLLVKINFNVNNINHYLDFILVQTDSNFPVDNRLYWEYTVNNQLENVKAPTNGATYSPLTLSVPDGTEYNPTYIKFSYLGEEFIIYNINGIYYNSFNNEQLDFSKMLFDLSGFYTVEIYDQTRFCYDSSNYLSYNFSIKNPESTFYLFTHNKAGKVVANNQISNSEVIVDLVNLDDIISSVNRVIITKSWRPSGGENISEQTVITENIPSTLNFNQDGTFNVRVINNDGRTIKECKFVLIKEIRTYFEAGDEKYEIGENEPANTYKTFTIPTKIASSYKDISGETNYTYSVTIAKSAPQISGIGNNGRKQGSVTLTIYGVGDIQVSVSKDGKETTNTKVTNGQALEKISEPGKYYVKITDQMGTTITKSFTIDVKMNGAAKAIIIIGIILVVVAIAVIIITRAKIKVR